MAEEPLILDIESLAHGGAGVGHTPEGLTVFVHGSAPGDRVSASVSERHPRYAVADVLDLVEAGPYRVQPPCPYFGECGGCQWQHVSYPAQVDAKRRMVADALSRIGGLDGGEVADVVRGPAPYGYRNKVELTAEMSEDGLHLGFQTRRATDLVEIDSCLLLPKQASRLPKAIAGALRFLSGRSDLALNRVAIRVAANTRDREVALWTAPGPFPRAIAASTLATAAHTDAVTRVISTHTRNRGRESVEVLTGRGAWRERLCGLDFLVSSPSFFQVNTKAAESLVELVLDRADLRPRQRVIDLYAGVGTFTLPLARADADVVAIESSGSAIRDLRRNLSHNRLDADVQPGDVARALPELGAAHLVVMDPPRSGLHASAPAALAATGAARLVYVSCDPATLARDAARLFIVGYRLVEAVPVDLFPQTFHVETMAVFDRV